MSQWTHVTGSIRFDTAHFFPEYDTEPKKEISKAFRKDIPVGSEGAIEFKVFQTGKQEEWGGDAEWGSIVFFADLRDYGDENSIYEWIVKSCQSLGKNWVRSMAIIIEVEYRGKFLVYDKYDDNYKSQILMKNLE